MKKTLWITYSWEDNKNGDVEFFAQELEKAGITVKLDRWNIKAGKRLWEQIDNFIINEAECDGWAIIATPNSLDSEPCKEEIAYALQRALENRGNTFPLIGVFLSSVDSTLIPSAIKTRLFVSVKDPDWIERIVSTLEQRDVKIPRQQLDPYTVEFKGKVLDWFVLELRPRAGTWIPGFVAIPIQEKSTVQPALRFAGRGHVPTSMKALLINSFQKPSADNEWFVIGQAAEASPTISMFFFYKQLPSKILFGGTNDPQYCVQLDRDQNSWSV